MVASFRTMRELNFDADILISCVESRPCLWDKSCDDYKDRMKTNNAWREVCRLMNEEFDTLDDVDQRAFVRDVIRKWGHLRDCFRRSLKQAGKKYVYHDQISFLRNVIGERRTDDTPPSLTTEEDCKIEIHYNPVSESVEEPPVIQYNPINEVESPVAQSSSSAVVNPHARSKRKRKKDDEADEVMIATTSHTQSRPRWKSDEVDEVIASTSQQSRTRRKAEVEEVMVATASPQSRSRWQSDEVEEAVIAHTRSRTRGDVEEVVLDAAQERENPYLSFFKGILPVIKDFNAEETIDFQLEVLQMIKNIRNTRSNQIDPLLLS